MIILPGGCTCSELTIYPEVRNKKSMNKYWYVQYYFRDPGFKQKYPSGKLCIVKGGLNRIKVLAERELAALRFLQMEKQKLLAGYNPITKTKAVVQTTELSPETPLADALGAALKKLEAVKETKYGATIVLRPVKKEMERLGYDYLPVKDVEPRHIKILLDSMSERSPFSPQKYNRYRANLMMLFKVLKKNFIIKINPATEIERKPVLQKIRPVLNEEERSRVNKLLKDPAPELYRFMHIFYHSGARKTELMGIKGKDVQLDEQRFKCVVRKRRGGPVEVEKLIKDIALPFWEEAMKECGPEDYVFSKGLRPGHVAINPKQISRRWRLWVKKHGITKTFYSLKHLHSTQVSEHLGIIEAAKHNSHTNTKMVESVYDVKNKERKECTIKTMDNAF